MLSCGNSLSFIYAHVDKYPIYQKSNTTVSIIDKVKDIQSKNIVLGGDFNVILDISLESLGGNSCLKKKSTAKLIQIKEKFDLCDIWRILNPKIKRFTF